MELLNVFDKHYKIFIAVVIGVILLAIGVIIVVPIMQENSRPTILEISIAPSTAKIEIGGKFYHNGAEVFEPGKYDVKVSQEGFTSKTVQVDVKAHQQTTLTTYLINKEEGLAYYERSAVDLQTLRLNKDSEEVAKFLEAYDKKVKIREILPINASYNLKDTNPNMSNYMIFMNIADGSTNDKCHYAFCLVVTGDRKNEKRVQEMLKINGYNHEDYEIIYE